jgi:cytochrome P450
MYTENSVLAERPEHVSADRVVDFDIFNPAGLRELGFQGAWKRLQDEAPYSVVWTPHNEGHWIAVRSRQIRKVYRAFSLFSSRSGINVPKSQSADSGLIPTMLDPPEHSAFREVFNRAIGVMLSDAGTEAGMRRVARQTVEELAPRGRCDLIADYAQVIPIKFFLGLIDLPFSDAERLKYLVDQMARPDGSMTMGQVMDGLFRYADPIIDERAGCDHQDLISLVINGSVNGQAMTRNEMQGTIAMLIVAGIDTVVNSLGFFFEFLAWDSERREELVANPGLVRKAVEEMLRRFPTIAECRMAIVNTDLDGARVRAGEMVCAPTVLAGLDEQANLCPMNVDFHRKKPSHQTFGEGVHLCAGQNIARLELKIAIEEWLRLIPEFQIENGVEIVHRSGSVATVARLPLIWGSGS